MTRDREGQRGDVIGGRYELIDVLGRGGLGAVWRARDNITQREVALKRLRGEFAADARLRRRMRREARAVARLEHPNIVRLYDLGEDPQRGPFLAMEIADGLSLYRTSRAAPLSLERTVRFVDQIAGALAFAHARGVVHRDIKPENVVITTNSEGAEVIKLLDFGLARVEDDSDDQLTNVGKDIFGTPTYMAPEQATGEFDVGPGSDIYSLGVVIWELFTGSPPYEGESGTSIVVQHVTSQPPPFVPMPRFDVPEGLERFLRRALEKEPVRRFASAGEMRRAFLGLFDDDEDSSGDEMTVVNEPPIDASAHDATITQVEALPIAPDRGVFSTDGFKVQLLGESAPFVDRDEVRRWMWQRVVAVCREKSQCTILLEGPVGIGKSRLVRWLRETLVEGGWMDVTGARCRPGGRAGGFREALLTAFEAMGLGVSGEGSLPGALAALPVGDSIDSETLSAFLWPTLNKTCPLGAAKRIVEQVVRSLAQRRPLFIWLDDIHRATTDEFAIFEHLATELNARPAPVLLLATRRSDSNSLLGTLPGAAQVDRFLQTHHDRCDVRALGPLSSEAVEGLVENYVTIDTASIERLITPARGNPLHVLRGLQFYMLNGALQTIGELTRLDPQVEALPIGLRALTRVRIDRMLEREHAKRDALDLFALLGDAFSFGLAETMFRISARDVVTLESTIDAFVRIGLLVDESGDAYAFEHELVREAVLDAVSRRSNAGELHGWAAAAKTEWYTNDSAAVAAEIARHHFAAGAFREAAEYILAAGAQARRSYRYDTASACYAEADRWLGQISDSASVDDVRADLMAAFGELALLQGDIERAGRLAWRLERWADTQEDVARATRARLISARALIARGRFDEAATVLNAAHTRCAAVNDVVGGAECELELGNVAAQRADDVTARTHYEAAAAAFGSAERWLGKSEARRGLGVLALRAGERKEAGRALHDAARLAKKAGDPLARGRATLHLAELLKKGGKPAAAAKVFADAASAFEAAGDLSHAARSFRGMGDVLRAHNEREAMSRYERAERLYNQLGEHHELTICLMKMGRLAEEMAEPEIARARYERALAALSDFDDPLREGLLQALIARASHRLGDVATRDLRLAAAQALDVRSPLVLGEWPRVLEEIAESLEPSKARPLFARAAEVWMALRRPEDARRAAGRAKG